MLSLKVLAKPKTAVEAFVASLVLWNPIIAGAFNLVLGGAYDFPRRWVKATTISELVAIQCFAGVYVFRWLEGAYHRHRGRSSPARSIGFHFFLAAAILLPASRLISWAFAAISATVSLTSAPRWPGLLFGGTGALPSATVAAGSAAFSFSAITCS